MGLTDTDRIKYKKLFLETARAYVADINKNLAVLLKNPQDTEALHSIYIACHSIKGQGFLMKFLFVAYYCAALEKICLTSKEKQLAIPEDVMRAMSEGAKRLEDSLSEIEKTGNELNLTEEIEKLNKIANTNKN